MAENEEGFSGGARRMGVLRRKSGGFRLPRLIYSFAAITFVFAAVLRTSHLLP